MSGFSIHHFDVLRQALDDLRARFFAAHEAGDPQAGNLARAYRQAWRQARHFSPAASRLIDQALQREHYHAEQAQRARAIRQALEARFVVDGEGAQ